MSDLRLSCHVLLQASLVFLKCTSRFFRWIGQRARAVLRVPANAAMVVAPSRGSLYDQWQLVCKFQAFCATQGRRPNDDAAAAFLLTKPGFAGTSSQLMYAAQLGLVKSRVKIKMSK